MAPINAHRSDKEVGVEKLVSLDANAFDVFIMPEEGGNRHVLMH